MIKNNNILPARKFFRRVLIYTLFAFSLLFISVSIGILGYKYIAHLGWVDSFYNASMILTGMGPVNEMPSNSAKLFASFYALFSGIVFLSTVAIFFAPFAHRIMHKLHVDPDNEEN